MKARIKETGKWITVDTCDDGFFDVETHCIYEPDELDFASAFDWNSFRREAAKDILCSMVRGGYDWGRRVEQAKLAVLYVEELIKALQKEKA